MQRDFYDLNHLSLLDPHWNLTLSVRVLGTSVDLGGDCIMETLSKQTTVGIPTKGADGRSVPCCPLTATP